MKQKKERIFIPQTMGRYMANMQPEEKAYLLLIWKYYKQCLDSELLSNPNMDPYDLLDSEKCVLVIPKKEFGFDVEGGENWGTITILGKEFQIGTCDMLLHYTKEMEKNIRVTNIIVSATTCGDYVELKLNDSAIKDLFDISHGFMEYRP
jgi:hypothetical protein